MNGEMNEWLKDSMQYWSSPSLPLCDSETPVTSIILPCWFLFCFVFHLYVLAGIAEPVPFHERQYSLVVKEWVLEPGCLSCRKSDFASLSFSCLL
jgi:hypothetical protein